MARMGDTRCAYSVLMRRTGGKTPLGIPRYIVEDIIKIDIKILAVASGYGPVAGSCEHSPEFSGCVQYDQFLDQMNDYHLINCNLIGFCFFT